MKNVVKIFKKNFKHLQFAQKNRLLAHCYDSSKTIISHLL